MPSTRAFAALGGFVVIGLVLTLALAQPWQPAPAFEPPDPPDDRSNESLREYALAYERALLDFRLRTDPDVTKYGFGEPTAPKRTAVTRRTTDGVYVRVQRPYWAETRGGHGDDLSRATYFVRGEAVWRVADSPTRSPDVSTYRGPGGSALNRPVDVRVLHFGTVERSVALDVTYRGDESEAVWTDRSVAVPANGTVTIRGALARTGAYEITVAVGGRTVTREFVVSSNRTGDVVVYVGPGDRLVVRRGTGW